MAEIGFNFRGVAKQRSEILWFSFQHDIFVLRNNCKYKTSASCSIMTFFNKGKLDVSTHLLVFHILTQIYIFIAL